MRIHLQASSAISERIIRIRWQESGWSATGSTGASAIAGETSTAACAHYMNSKDRGTGFLQRSQLQYMAKVRAIESAAAMRAGRLTIAFVPRRGLKKASKKNACALWEASQTSHLAPALRKQINMYTRQAQPDGQMPSQSGKQQCLYAHSCAVAVVQRWAAQRQALDKQYLKPRLRKSQEKRPCGRWPFSGRQHDAGGQPTCAS